MAVVAKNMIVDLSSDSFAPQTADPNIGKDIVAQPELSSEAHEAYPSPARDLQVTLEARLGQGGLWSRRRMLALAVGFSAMFWASFVAAFAYFVGRA